MDGENSIREMIQRNSQLAQKNNTSGSISQNLFEALYRQYASELIFFARKFVDFPTAEDIVHDAFLKIWDKQNFINIVSHPGTKNYLFRSVQNGCYDYLKHRAVERSYLPEMTRKIKIEELEWYHSYEQTFSPDEIMNTIEDVIEKLPPRCREIFTKAYLNGKTHKEIASQLNLSVRTIETQIYKALKLIRDKIFLFFLSLSILFS